MRNWVIGIVVSLGMVLILATVAMFGTNYSNNGDIEVVNGYVDLSDMEAMNKETIELSGEWKFYEGKLYQSVDEIEADRDTVKEYIVPVPAHWNVYETGREGVKAIGSGTFRTTVKLSDTEKIYGLKISGLMMSSKVIVNGKEVGSSGITGLTKENYVPKHVSFTVYFISDSEEVDILVQVSNYDYGSYGGMTRPVVIGEADIMTAKYIQSAMVDAIVSAIIFAVFILFMFLYFFGKREKYILYFAAHNFTLMIYIMTHGERLWYRLFTGTDYRVFMRMQFLFASLLFLFLTLYIHKVLPGTLNVKVVKTLTGYISVFAVASLIGPIVYLSIIVNFNMMLILVVGAYMLIKMFLAANRVSEFRVFIMISAMATLFTVIIEMMDLLGIVNLGYALLIAQLIQVITHSLLVSARVSSDRKEAERLSVEIVKANKEKVVLMEQRIESMEEKKRYEMAFLQAQIKPHFLYNTLNTIGGLCIKDQYEAEKLVVSFATYLRESLDFDNLSELVSLEKELKLIKTYADIENVRFENLEVVIDVKLSDETLKRKIIPPITLQTLVENAIKHGVRNRVGDGSVSIHVNEDEERVNIIVEDNGVGIDKERLKHIFNQPKSRDSIGVYNVNQRLQNIYGKGLTFESTPGLGTKVSFSIKKN